MDPPNNDVFPLCRLPLVVQLLVLQRMTVCELFVVSQTSKRLKRLSAHARKLASACLTVRIRLDSTLLPGSRNQLAVFQTNVPDEYALVLTTPTPPNPPVAPITTLLSVPVYLTEGTFFAGHGSAEQQHLVIDEFLSALIDTFNIMDFHLELGNRSRDTSAVWKHSNIWSRVLCRGAVEMGGAEVERLLGSLDIRGLEISSPVAPGFRYSGRLAMTTFLQLDNMEFLSADALRTLRCGKLFVTSDGPSIVEQLRCVLDAWTAGGFDGLESVHVRHCQVLNEAHIAEFCASVDSFAWDVANRPMVFHNVDASNLTDFRRQSDGRLASIGLTSGVHGRSFKFFIWHDKYLRPKGPPPRLADHYHEQQEIFYYTHQNHEELRRLFPDE